MRKIHLRPFFPSDAGQLEQWRKAYTLAELEVPHGYEGPGVETVVAYKDGRTLFSLTGTQIVALDPLVKNPQASDLDVMEALFAAEGALVCGAARHGAVDAFVAVPREAVEYIRILKRCGYEETAQNCVILRRPILGDVDLTVGSKSE